MNSQRGHGHGHSHRAGRRLDDEIRIGTTARNLLLAALALALLGTLAGLVVWWPPSDAAERSAEAGGPAAEFAAPGVTFPTGEVVSVAERCPTPNGFPDGSGCSTLTVTVDGEAVRIDVPPEVVESGLEPGDHVELLRTPAPEDAADQSPSYSYFATERHGTLVWLGVLFVAVVLAIARLRGLLGLLGLAFGGVVVWWWMLPALLDGAPGVGVALTSAAAIMFVVLYTTHGFSLRTSTALAGTLLGIVLTAGIGVLAIGDARLTGISDESGAILASFGALDFQDLLGCALVIAGLGVLNDVTITQASAVWELRAATPDASRTKVFASAMRIGRDHIASTIYTIVFAYVGTALILLMLLRVYDRPLLELISTEQLAEEVIRTLVTSIGLVLAVPVTTALAAVIAAPRGGDDAARPGPGEVTATDRSTPAARPRRRGRA